MREEDTVCVGSDGLQYCKVCGEAKEAFFPEDGFMGMKKHSRRCACDRKAYEEEQKYFKDKEHRELVSRNTSICFDESRMEEWTFENADMSDAVMHKAKSYVDNWEEMKRNHIGCLFWGPVGTGKSFIAGCIANELLKQEVTVKMTNFNTIIDDIFPLADKTEYINALASYQLLIIDDLGVERNSEYALGIIFSVIDRRIRSGRPLIITTNLPLKEIKSETMLDKRRIDDRILEMCTPMYVGGTSKREVTVKMTNFNTIIDDIFPLADKTEYINALASYQLLIIDDLGVERNSEYALGIIFSVIDRRIRSGRPLIITTNLPLKEIKSETMLDKRRIYDRILEMCTPMYVGGTSKREMIASMKMEKAKTLLNTNRGEEECE